MVYLTGFKQFKPKFNNYLLLAIKNFSSKMNLSSHHVMAYLVHEEKKKRHQFYIAVQKCMDGTTEGIIIKY